MPIKSRADLEVISERKNFAKRNYIQRIKVKAGQLKTITVKEFRTQYGNPLLMYTPIKDTKNPLKKTRFKTCG